MTNWHPVYKHTTADANELRVSVETHREKRTGKIVVSIWESDEFTWTVHTLDTTAARELHTALGKALGGRS